ncbi:MAG TPA: hypothetical protein PLJ60_15105 [Chryseolinea sp.]|nr:hypothetical protein [Chryseolinea sp.]HPM31661.1 hypothetical protein [Chryseolinea sp.]
MHKYSHSRINLSEKMANWHYLNRDDGTIDADDYSFTQSDEDF